MSNVISDIKIKNKLNLSISLESSTWHEIQFELVSKYEFRSII
jgi:hypothetical protein